MSNKIEIYTKPFCVYCQRAKDLLRIKDVDFVEYDITVDGNKSVEIDVQSRGDNIPEIFVNGTFLGGCQELFELDESGILDALLGLVSSAGSPSK